jgi:hypothetical protein
MMEKGGEDHLYCTCRVENANNSKIQGDILHIIKRRKANQIGYMLRSNQHVIEGKTKGAER